MPKTPQTISGWILYQIKRFFFHEASSKEELVALLHHSQKHGLLTMDALLMLEGVLQFSEMKVRDVMLPRTQMVTLRCDFSLEEIFKIVIDSGHSRFPVLSELKEKDEILGILHAKSLLAYKRDIASKFELVDLLRPAAVIPESKRIDILLKDFRNNRNHMAIVVNEYGGVAGVVTIEDIIEQIVGEISDEFDIMEDPYIKKHSEKEFIIKARMSIEDFNEAFQTTFTEDEADTIGGIVLKAFGYLPKRGEHITIKGFEFKVMNADSRRIRLVQLTLLPDAVTGEGSQSTETASHSES